MPIPLEMLFGAPTEAERTRATADTLRRRLVPESRRREAIATLGVVSGDPVLGEWGRGEMEYLREQTQALRKARQEANRLRPTGTPGFMYSQSEGIKEIPGYQEAQEAAREDKLRLEVFKRRATAEAAARKREESYRDRLDIERAKLEMPTRSQAASARETQAFMPELLELKDSLRGIEIPMKPEILAGGARSYLPEGVAEATAAGIERKGMSPEAVDWLARGRHMEQQVMRLASGLAVTGFELENIKKWSPWALGLTNRERTKRIQNIYNEFGRKSNAILNRPWETVTFEEGEVKTPEEMEIVTEGALPEGWKVRVK